MPRLRKTNRKRNFNPESLPQHLKFGGRGGVRITATTTSDNTMKLVAYEAIIKGEAIYIGTDEQARIASLSNSAIAIALESASAGETFPAATSGAVVANTTSLVAGSRVWLSNTTSNTNLSTTIPTPSPGDYVQALGVATTSSSIIINVSTPHLAT